MAKGDIALLVSQGRRVLVPCQGMEAHDVLTAMLELSAERADLTMRARDRMVVHESGGFAHFADEADVAGMEYHATLEGATPAMRARVRLKVL